MCSYLTMQYLWYLMLLHCTGLTILLALLYYFLHCFETLCHDNAYFYDLILIKLVAATLNFSFCSSNGLLYRTEMKEGDDVFWCVYLVCLYGVVMSQWTNPTVTFSPLCPWPRQLTPHCSRGVRPNWLNEGQGVQALHFWQLSTY